jgi:3-methyladenine DNA glycosylase/8-oxoguanine DNA glycosylase
VFARLVAVYGSPDPFGWHDGGRTGDSKFAAMLLHIVGQQISASVAFAVYDRITTAGGEIPTPAGIRALGAERLRECGLSAAKAGYALALAEAQLSGQVDIENLDRHSDKEIVDELTAIRGIGTWSAETFLIHNLHRPDVLPAADLGIRRAVRIQWELEADPSPKTARAMAAAWTPWRTYAAALLWRSLAPPDEPSDPKERALLREAATASERRKSAP